MDGKFVSEAAVESFLIFFSLSLQSIYVYCISQVMRISAAILGKLNLLFSTWFSLYTYAHIYIYLLPNSEDSYFVPCSSYLTWFLFAYFNSNF